MAKKVEPSLLTKQQAERRKAEFLKEQRIRRLQLQAGGVVFAIAAFLLVVIFGGDTFGPVRTVLGLGWLLHEEQGVYADCTKEENRDIRYCRRDYASQLKDSDSGASTFDRPDHRLPFTLTRD